jgi:hypothetical protein
VRDSQRRGCEDTALVPDSREVAVPPVPEITDSSVLVRIPAPDRSWAATLPAVPDDHVLTVTLGHPRLLRMPVDDLVAAGYRIAGVASEHRPIGDCVDVLVPESLRLLHPAWWRDLVHRADRVFDLRLGPVQQVLAAELALHARAAHA